MPVQPDGPGGATQPPLAQGESRPTEREPLPSRCPRCSAVIDGDYRFCPSCAYRLRPGTDAAEAEAPPRRSRLRTIAAIALLVGAVAVALLVWQPALFESHPRPPTAAPESLSYAEPAFTVADIKDSLVELPSWGYAFESPISTLPDIDDDLRARLLSENPETGTVPALIWYPLRVMRTEVTEGQYEEFLRDVHDNRKNVPPVWIEEQKGAKVPEDVELWRHTPEHWIVRDRDGEPVSWHVEPLERNLPVVYVSYVDALGFAQWASKRLGMRLDVPTRPEWVRAARGGLAPPDDRLWPWGNEPLIYACNNAQFWPGGIGRREYVHFSYSEPRGGGGGATPEGLLAMAGNVREWASYAEMEIAPSRTSGAPTADVQHYLAWKPKSLLEDPSALAMGGSFRAGIDDCQVESDRRLPINDDKLSRRDDLGFRLVVRAE